MAEDVAHGVHLGVVVAWKATLPPELLRVAAFGRHGQDRTGAVVLHRFIVRMPVHGSRDGHRSPVVQQLLNPEETASNVPQRLASFFLQRCVRSTGFHGSHHRSAGKGLVQEARPGPPRAASREERRRELHLQPLRRLVQEVQVLGVSQESLHEFSSLGQLGRQEPLARRAQRRAPLSHRHQVRRLGVEAPHGRTALSEENSVARYCIG
eukprot:scaffold4101_cov267-Pinguiococcus_pyrenoidosus.AAC.5